jgi:predicted component of type VI protein secretion system
VHPSSGHGAGAAPGPVKEVNGRLVRLGQGETISIHGSGFRIGRDPLSELVVADPEVSRLHAEIRYEGGRYVLYDFSANGTWVNGELVAERKTLRSGDVVKVGRAEFRFLVDRVSADATTPPLPPRADLPVRATAVAAATVRRGARAARSRPALLYLVLLALAGFLAYRLLLA